MVEFYSGDVLEMAVHSLVILGKETTHTLLRCMRTELFELAELYLGECLEVAGCSADTGEETVHTLFRPLKTELKLFECLRVILR